MNKNLEGSAARYVSAQEHSDVPCRYEDLGIEQGQTVIVRGRRTTRATVRSSENAIQGRIYMDATTRLNSSSRMTDIVQVGLDDNPRTVSGSNSLPSEKVSQGFGANHRWELSMRPISRGTTSLSLPWTGGNRDEWRRYAHGASKRDDRC